MKRCLLFLLAFIIFDSIAAQICEGSLGNNIFERGDFGSGPNNLLPVNPGIAPGYQYTLNPPPDDGFYTITNNTGDWINLYPTWLAIGDNSSDPNGYMMVVNASFDPGVFYEETISGTCASTFYEFSADIINLIIPGTTGHIDPNVDFLIDGQVVYSTGNIPKTGEWNKYGFTFETRESQADITLTLRNNAPGGIGNDLAIDNISFRPCGPKSFIDLDSEETVFLCVEGEPVNIIADIVAASGQQFSLFWQESPDGEEWQDMGIVNEQTIAHEIFIPGDYYYRYVSAADDASLDNDKCRIISDVIHIEVLPRFFEFRDSFCMGSSYNFNDRVITNGGQHIDTLLSSFGCDSIVNLTLIELPDEPIEIETETIDPTCYEFSDGMINVTSVEGGYGEYQYYLNGVLGSSENPSLVAGNYTINIIDQYGCSEQRELTLVDPDLFIVDIGEDRDIILGDVFTLEVASNYEIESYDWFPATFFSCQGCPLPNVVPTDNGYITLTVTNGAGCLTSDSIFVHVSRDKAIFIPNIFSPNDDGINDRFEIRAFNNSVRLIRNMSVYNRWGNLVYKEENFTLDDLERYWNGKIDNRVLPTGVYSYVLEIEYLDGQTETRSGDVTLIE